MVPFGIRIVTVVCLILSCSSSSFNERLTDVKALQDSGRFGESVSLLRELVDERPADPEVNYLLGIAFIRSHQSTLAAWPLSNAARSPDYAVGAGLLLASSLLATGNPEEAIETSDRVLTVDSQQIAAIEFRARAYLMIGRPEAALADAERILGLQRGHLAALGIRASALIGLERLGEAEETLLLLSDQAAEEGPDTEARICVAHASLLKKRSQPARSEARLLACIEAFPSDQIVVSTAVEFFDATDRAEVATRILRDAVELAPEALGMRVWLADRLRVRGKQREAEQLLLTATEQFPSVRVWTNLAEFYRRQEDATAARHAFERALELPGGDAERLRFTYAELLVDLGEPSRAEEIAVGFTNPTYADLIRGRVLLGRGNAQGALASLEAGIQLWPNNPRARYFAGQAAQALGDLGRAISEYREAIRADPRATPAALALARIQEARGEYRAALNYANNHIRSHPAEAGGYLVAASAATAIGAYGAARNLLGRLEEFDGTTVTVLVGRAKLERAASGPEAAAKIIAESGLELADPANEALVDSLVEDLLTLGRQDEALALLDTLLARRPQTSNLYTLRGRTMRRAGRPADLSRRSFEEALERKPGDAAALVELGSLAWQEGDRGLAVSLFDQAAMSDPPEMDRAYLQAQLFLTAGNLTEAEERLRALAIRLPHHARACNDLAWLLAEEDTDLDLALELAKRASRLEAGAPTYDTLGWVHFKRGEAEEAAEVLALAVQVAPEIQSMRYRLGLALAAKGDRAGALRAFRHALGIGSFAEAEAARTLIAQLSSAEASKP